MTSYHTTAAIVSIGDELTLGQSLDTNSRWLSDRLLSLGIITLEHATIGDDLVATAATFRRLGARASLVISTGGLGPTLDDLTRQAVAALLREELVTDEDALEMIRARIEARGRVMTEIQRTQALRPPSAAVLPNSRGTAPGLRARIDDRSDLFCLPGPPGEMHAMFAAHVEPFLRRDPSRTVLTRFVHLVGLGEGDAATRLGDLMDRSRLPLVGITASGSVLTCRVRYEGPLAEAEAAAMVEGTVRAIHACLGEFIFGDGDETLASAVVRDMRHRGRTLATVESCTGGALGAAITDVAGSSNAYVGGLVTYANELKETLAGVDSELLREHGAVSEQVARAMARGGLARTGASNCLAVTGIAGPEGGTPGKPVGTVWIAHAWEGGDDVRRFVFPGERDDVRKRTVMAALAMVLKGGGGRMLWEAGGKESPRAQ